MLMASIRRRAKKERKHGQQLEALVTYSEPQSFPEGVHAVRIGQEEPNPSTEAGGEDSQGQQGQPDTLEGTARL